MMALRARVPDGARVLRTGHRVLPELAAFANGVAMRYLDGNDTYPGGGGTRAAHAQVEAASRMAIGASAMLRCQIRAQSTTRSTILMNALTSASEGRLTEHTAKFISTTGSIHADDYDDTFHPTRVHATSPVVAAVLAEAEQTGASGEEVLRAITVGTEVTCKVSLAMAPLPHG